jgi:hypothetical protein
MPALPGSGATTSGSARRSTLPLALSGNAGHPRDLGRQHRQRQHAAQHSCAGRPGGAAAGLAGTA